MHWIPHRYGAGGGIYDGTYGVLSGIECVQRLKELGYQNRHPIQVIAFTEEEGNVIGGTFEVRHLPAERLMKLCGQIWPSTDLQWSRSVPAEEI